MEDDLEPKNLEELLTDSLDHLRSLGNAAELNLRLDEEQNDPLMEYQRGRVDAYNDAYSVIKAFYETYKNKMAWYQRHLN